MPYVAEKGDELVSPGDISPETTVYCPYCGGEMGLRDGHYNQGTRIPQHFFHRSGADCGGESDTHKWMKAVARYQLEQIFPMAEIDTEVGIGDGRIADVLAELPRPMKPFGRGVAVEVQHKHEDKNIGATSQAYLRAGFSVYWAYQSDFERDEMDIVEKRVRTVWPDALPDRDGIEGYSGVVQQLWRGEFRPSREAWIPFPPEYWRTHALEIISPRHGHFDTEWDLVDEVWLHSEVQTLAWLGINKAPNGAVFLEPWTKDQQTGETSHLPIQVREDDLSRLQEFIEDARSAIADDPDPPIEGIEVLAGMWFEGTEQTRGWLSLLRRRDGRDLLRFGRIDRKGNERTLSLPYLDGDLERMNPLLQALMKAI